MNFLRSINKIRKLSIIPGGVFGFLIVLLTWATFTELIPSFLDVITDYRVIGFLPGLGLIPLIHSAKQKYQIAFYDEIDETEVDGVTLVSEKSFIIPVAGWLHKTKTTIHQSELNTASAKFIIGWHRDLEARTWEGSSTIIDNQNHMQFATERWNTSSVTEMQTTFPMHVFFIDDAVPAGEIGAQVRETKIGGPGRLLDQGELLFCTSSYTENGAQTAGKTWIVSVATVIVVAFDSRKNPSEEVPPYTYIFFEGIGSTNSGFSWPANSNMRIANLRATVFSGYANDSWLIIGENPEAPITTHPTIEIQPDSNDYLSLVEIPLDTAVTGIGYNRAITNYARGPFYIKKGEVVQVRMDNISGFGVIEFQYIPDFGHLAEFFRVSDIAEFAATHASQFYAMFTVPYDMYVTSIEGSVNMTDTTNDHNDPFYIMGLKSMNMLDSNDLLLGWAPGDVEGNILGATLQSGAMPWVIKAIPTNIDTSVTPHYQGTFGESVADFYPAGSAIGIYVPATWGATVTIFRVLLTIEGLVRIKTRNVGSNHYAGDFVQRMEVMV